MLNYAQKRTIDALRVPCSIVLATDGPAGLLAGEFPCESIGLILYLLIPKTSDHLFNLEKNSGVTLVAAGWELKGEAHIISPDTLDIQLHLLSKPVIEWSSLVLVRPKQMQFRRNEDWGNLETIDFP